MTKTEYQQLVELFTRHFTTIDRHFDVIDRRFDAVDQRFDVIDRHFDGIDGRGDEAQSWFTKIAGVLRRLEDVGPLHASIARIERLLRA